MKRFFRWVKNLFKSKPVVVKPTPKPEPAKPIVIIPAPVHEITPVSRDDIKHRTVNYYRSLYASMHIAKPSFVQWSVKHIQKNEDIYRAAEKLTGVDWRIIAVIHELEGGGNFDRQILNGEKWTRRTRLVPKGEGPWQSWEESCISAFKHHHIKSNDIGDVLKFLERYNGLGYIRKGINSPYIWSYTNHYIKGKYVADGKYSSSAVSKQIGAAPILKSLGF